MERYVIHVTKACNMKCSYCYETDKTSTYTWEEVRELCKNIIEQNHDNADYSVEFLGGEPMLAFDYIKQAVDYFHKNSSEHAKYFIITTNGTIVNNDLIAFLKKNNDVMISFSLDGNKEANEFRTMKKNDDNSYNIVTYNIKKLLLSGVQEKQLSVHMVTHPFNSFMIHDSICDIYSMGIRSISVGTVENAYALGPNYKKEFLEQMHMVAEDIVFGDMKDLRIDLFDDFDTSAPKKRIYIRDNSGKMICESYGVMNNDITKTNIYDSSNVTSNLVDFIFSIRKEVCLYYRKLREQQ